MFSRSFEFFFTEHGAYFKTLICSPPTRKRNSTVLIADKTHVWSQSCTIINFYSCFRRGPSVMMPAGQSSWAAASKAAVAERESHAAHKRPVPHFHERRTRDPYSSLISILHATCCSAPSSSPRPPHTSGGARASQPLREAKRGSGGEIERDREMEQPNDVGILAMDIYFPPACVHQVSFLSRTSFVFFKKILKKKQNLRSIRCFFPLLLRCDAMLAWRAWLIRGGLWRSWMVCLFFLFFFQIKI